MRNKKIRIVSVLCLLCVLLIGTTTVLAADYVGEGPFGFDLQAGGHKDTSPSVQKTDNAYYARIEFEEYDNLDDTPLYYRLRTGVPDEWEIIVSTLYEVDGICTQRPTYWSGYGVNGDTYVFRIQTDSSSSYGAEVGGDWVP